MHALADRLTQEHHALDRLCWEVYKAIDAGDRATATAKFREFEAMCEPHFQAEDEELFVEVVAQDERLRVHAQDMAREHDQLRQLTARMAKELAKEFTEETMFHCERLLRVLRGHAQKEELLLFSHAGVCA